MTQLLSAELLKLRTTRVPYVLAGVVVLLCGIAAATVVGARALGDDPALDLVQGAGFSTALATIVGILLVTNEYRHGTIATTFLAEPHRIRVLGAKLVTGLLAGALYAALAVAITAAVALPWLAARGDALTLDGQALEAVGRLLVSFTLSGALGVAIGAILQNQVGAIITTFVWFLVVEPLLAVLAALLAGDISEQSPISKYLPGAAFDALVGGTGGDAGLRFGPALALAIAYVAALSALGALAMTRRDP